jgi:hypothetical protein
MASVVDHRATTPSSIFFQTDSVVISTSSPSDTPARVNKFIAVPNAQGSAAISKSLKGELLTLKSLSTGNVQYCAKAPSNSDLIVTNFVGSLAVGIGWLGK